MSTILVTGSEGNIGTYIVRRLRRRHPDERIIRVGRMAVGIEPVDKNDKIYLGDLTDPAFAKQIFKENHIDYVIYAAAKTYDAGTFKSQPFAVFAHDSVCLTNILNQSQKIKKFVYLSSATVYESSAEKILTEEIAASVPIPKSPYGIAKFFGEKAVELFGKQHCVKFTMWRLFNVVSPLEPHLVSGGHVYVDFYRKIFVERQPKIEIFGSGQQVRCFGWVEDVANTIVDFLDDTRTDNEIFNLGSTDQTTLAGLLQTMIDIGKKKKFLPSDYKPEVVTGEQFYGVDTAVRIPDISKVEKILGWKPKTGFRACFEKFIEYKKYHADK